MQTICWKLKKLKQNLKELDKSCYSNITLRTIQKRDQLVQLQGTLQNGPCDANIIQKERELRQVSAELLKNEEEFYHRKSRTRWLKDGDRNTAFFHRQISNHNAKNRILHLKKEDGTVITNCKEVQEAAVAFYAELFTRPAD